MSTRTKPKGGYKPNKTLAVEQRPDETGAQAMARKLLEPHLRHALTASTYAEKVLGSDVKGPGIMDFVDHVQAAANKAEKGGASGSALEAAN